MSEHAKEPKKPKGYFRKSSVKNYRGNTAEGFKGFKWQAHHVLVAACFASIVHPNLSYIKKCLKITDWNINESYNMYGLPIVKSYILAYKNLPGMGRQTEKKEFKQMAKWLGRVSGKLGETPKNLPCHNPSNWGHTDYTKEVRDALKIRVWDTLDKQQKPHEGADQIKPKLDTLAKEFKGKLILRGNRPDGTEINWRNRHEPGYENKWFHPFSMSARPIKQDLF